jgi:YhcH/YjgK/YiaL family protein
MILVPLRNWHRYAVLPDLRPAFRFLEEHADGSRLTEGQHRIDGSRGAALLEATWPKLASDCPFETHPNHIEIIYLIAGSELVGYTPAESLGPQLSYDGMADTAVYGDPQEFVQIQLRAQDLVCVLYPEDGHMAGCRLDTPGPIHRIVITVPADSIG